MVFQIVLVVHILGCVLLTIVVLMQSSRGGALSAAFGGSSGQIFGGRETATFLSKATQYLAILFFLTSLSLAFLSTGRGGSRTASALRKAASQYGTVVPEEQKNVQDVLGNVPQPGQGGAAQGAPKGSGAKPAENAQKPKAAGK